MACNAPDPEERTLLGRCDREPGHGGPHWYPVLSEGYVNAEAILARRRARCIADGLHYVGGAHVAGACRACGTRT
jgi:hypothetical protein